MNICESNIKLFLNILSLDSLFSHLRSIMYIFYINVSGNVGENSNKTNNILYIITIFINISSLAKTLFNYIHQVYSNIYCIFSTIDAINLFH